MTQEDKELLLKDLCARLPYGLKYNYGGYDGCDYTMNRVDCNAVDCAFPIENVKPYLFPLSNMTEEQKVIYGDLCYSIIQSLAKNMQSELNELINWLNAHHFDYRGLIEKGLAIDATNLNIY